MDNPVDQQTTITAGAVASWAATAGVAAALSSLRRKVTMAVATFHVALASFIGPCSTYAILAFWPKIPPYIGIPASAAIGLSIFGISVMLDKTNRKIEDVDPTRYLPDKLRPPDGEKKP